MSQRHFKKHKLMERLAAEVAGLSTCKRTQVGCVIYQPDYSAFWIGYNGPPAGMDDARCSGEAGACGCVHAEANALLKAWEHARGAVLMVTMTPCLHCAGLIVNAHRAGRVQSVVYGSVYRDNAGMLLLAEASVYFATWKLQAEHSLNR